MQAYDRADHVDKNVSVWTGKQFPNPDNGTAIEHEGATPLARLPDCIQTHPIIVHTAREGVK